MSATVVFVALTRGPTDALGLRRSTGLDHATLYGALASLESAGVAEFRSVANRPARWRLCDPADERPFEGHWVREDGWVDLLRRPPPHRVMDTEPARSAA